MNLSEPELNEIKKQVYDFMRTDMAKDFGMPIWNDNEVCIRRRSMHEKPCNGCESRVMCKLALILISYETQLTASKKSLMIANDALKAGNQCIRTQTDLINRQIKEIDSLNSQVNHAKQT